jgi:hypothetical protein
MMIAKHIADLLYSHECVIVPGLGGFIRVNTPARVIHAGHGFFPPSGKIAFNAGLSVNDGVLANHISNIENTSFREALYEIRRWVDSVRTQLAAGEFVLLENIGELFLNAAGHTEFLPSGTCNFNADAFGLPEFVYSPAGQETQIPVPDVQPVSGPKLRRLIPETLKWAAVLAPFIGFALWGTLNRETVSDYVHSYSGFYSWVSDSPADHSKSVTSAAKSNEAAIAPEITSVPGILAGRNVSCNPGAISYATLSKLDLEIMNSAEGSPLSSPEAQPYHIVGGAFRDQGNAMKMIQLLGEKGYHAFIADTTPGGLFVVSMSSCSTYEEACSLLEQTQKSGFPAAWILRKQKI